MVLKDVAHRHQLDVRSGVDALGGGAASPAAPRAAAADQADADHVVASGVNGWNIAQVRYKRCARDGGGRPEKITARARGSGRVLGHGKSPNESMRHMS